MSSKRPHVYEFGPFRLDPSVPFLWRDDGPVSLTPKALETLVALVERGGRVVSREELIVAVWPDVAVEENNLSVNVSALRKALGDGEEGEKYIETVPRRGYRFTAPVRDVPVESAELIYTRHTRSLTLTEESSEPEGQRVAVALDSALDVTPHATSAHAIVKKPTSLSSRYRRLAHWPVMLAGLVAVVALAAGAGLIRRGWERDSHSVERRGAGVGVADGGAVRLLAVLPFKEAWMDNFAPSNGGGHGKLTDAVIARLVETGKVNVAPQDGLLAQQATHNNMLIAGRVLRVDAVLTGTVLRNTVEEIRVRMHLVSVNGGEVLWADTLGSPRDELPGMMESIARNVLAGLQRLRSAEEYEQRASRYTANREAYQHYLQGRFLWEQRYDVFGPSYFYLLESRAASINQQERARALDPNFALAYLGLADDYKTSDYKGDEWRLGEEYALKVIGLDSNLAEAHATLGFIRMFHYWDWAGAEAEFKRALELNPDCITAHQWYALFHALRGNNNESIKEITRARELAPYSISIAVDSAEMQYNQAGAQPDDDYANAISPLVRVLNLHSGAANAQVGLSNAYWMNGDLEKSVAITTSGLWQDSPQDYARSRAGPRKGSREFDDIKHPSTYDCARWNAVLNRREEALDLLERAYRDHHFFIIYIKAEPFFKNLRDEPRYQELLRRVGLDP